MDNFMVAFVSLLGAVFISRMVNERANKKLDQAKKAELVDLFSDTRIFTFGILIAIIVFFYLSLKFNWIDPLITYLIYAVSIIAFLVVNSIYSVRTLKKNSFPDSYIKSFLVSTIIRFLGMLVFFALLQY